VFPGSSVKRKVNYEFFVRPTIDWSLECELNGKTRADKNNFNIEFKADGPNPASKGLAITALILLFNFPLFGAAGNSDNSFAAFFGISFLLSTPFTFGFLMTSAISYNNWMQLLQEDLDNLDEAIWFNDCVDDLSKLDPNVIKLSLEGQMIRVKGLAYMLLIH